MNLLLADLFPFGCYVNYRFIRDKRRLIADITTMPVTFDVCKHPAKPVSLDTPRSPEVFVDHARNLMTEVNEYGRSPNKPLSLGLLSTSLEESKLSQIAATKNGFVDSCISAYGGHHNLVIRPDDVWLAILVQFNFYVNGHAEELRDKFVAHKGKKELKVEVTGRDRWSVDYEWIARAFTELLDVRSLSLRILPSDQSS